MPDRRSLIGTLKTELLFLENDGYRKLRPRMWRAPLIFEDSPSCMNSNAPRDQRRPCSECVLMELVPPEHHAETAPCRHIPLTDSGDTVATMYRHGTQEEIEETMHDWLKATIQELEKHERQHRVGFVG
jgi:hypothetical protein